MRCYYKVAIIFRQGYSGQLFLTQASEVRIGGSKHPLKLPRTLYGPYLSNCGFL